jgi:O-antigen ligase
MKKYFLSTLLGLGVVVSTLAWVSGVMFPYVAGKLMIFAVVIVVGMCGLAMHMWNTKSVALPSWITLSFGSLTLLATVSLAWSSNVGVSVWGSDGRGEGIFLLALLTLFSWLLDQLHTEERKRVSYITLGSSVIVSLYVLFSFLGNTAHRSEGFHGNAILFALYCYIMIALGITVWLQEQKKWVLVPTGLLTIALIASQTRGVILAAVIAIFLYIGLQILNGVSPRLKKLSLVVGASLVLAIGSLLVINQYSPLIQERASFIHRIITVGGALDSDRQRLFIWKTAIEALQERPLVGYGSQMFFEAFDTHYDARLTRYGFSQVWSDRAHNVYVDIAVMYGWIGVVWYALVLIHGTRKLKGNRFALEYGVMGVGLGIAYFFEFTGVADMIILVLVLQLMSGEESPRKKIPKEASIMPLLSLVIIFPVHIWYATSIAVSQAVTQPLSVGATEVALSHVNNSSIFQRDYLLRLADVVFRTVRNTSQDNEYARHVAEALENYIQKKPNDVGMLVALGNVHLKTALTISNPFSTLDTADTWYARASAQAPNKQTMYLQRANIALQKKDFDQAEELFAQAYLLDKDNNTLEFQFGAMLLSINREYEAMTVLRAYYDRFATEKMFFVPSDEKELTNIARHALVLNNIDVMAYALANIVRNNDNHSIAKENLESALKSGQLHEVTIVGIEKMLTQ